MGLKKNRVSAADALAKIDINAFQPIELTEGNVEAIFNRCLKTDKTVKERFPGLAIEYSTAKLVDTGANFIFDADVVQANLKTIEYLLGQLTAFHKDESNVDLIKLAFRYDSEEKPWTGSDQALFKLCYLGLLSWHLANIVVDGDSYTVRTMHRIKTLSPRDPNFPAWWEAHKAEWEN